MKVFYKLDDGTNFANRMESMVYSNNVLEFAAVASESCSFLERAFSFERKDFVERLVKLLPLIYLKTSMLPPVSDEPEDEPERFVAEDEYERVRQVVVNLLGQFDSYLETLHPDIQLSEEGIAASIGENLADMYQDLRDFSENYRLGNEETMHAALGAVIASFREHWGQKLLNALRALHYILYNEDLTDEAA